MRGIAAPVSLNTLLSGDGVGKRRRRAKISARIDPVGRTGSGLETAYGAGNPPSRPSRHEKTDVSLLLTSVI
ncbi:hypothetical protein LB561_05075 [Mesorhizobium sp. B292B1B]|uniref:hypothetical protein n=1 Tax=unclassified Mesorhizobium TaxID=325217 RepID=UPI001127D424|nr:MULTISPECIES: hypothetical protein [unclassified Mesorhizobium]MCA0015216.1 hypothetical protein [Mesorhizobium sp. B294B1A1]MCA0036660.1 hypothetical protein [Mesorhizobium sp. B292B1B]TPM46658.1 hypothetical protein FJ964_12145 [Mesorhizobium sp. B2-3-2]